MRKSIDPMLFLKSGARPFAAPPRSHRLDEFAAGYSLAGCSPAWPASASLAGFHLQAAAGYLSTVSFEKDSALDSKARIRQTINIQGGPFQTIKVGQAGRSNSPAAVTPQPALHSMPVSHRRYAGVKVSFW